MKTRTLASPIAGFTLIELMIVVAIIGLLAGIGIPIYTDYARSAKRTDAHTALARISSQQERFFSDNNRYGTLTELGYASASVDSPEGFWTITATFPTVASYSLTAVPGGSETHTDPDCTSINLTSVGSRTSSPTADCW